MTTWIAIIIPIIVPEMEQLWYTAFLNLTPSEPYEPLLKTHSDITQKTIQIIIPSYLGIGRERLTDSTPKK